MPTLMYDTFKIANKRLINNEDINSLTKLYLPLMGMDSYALYLGLSTLDVNVDYNFKYLIDTLALRGLSSINKASNKLEGLGLLDVYENKDKDIIYYINRPRSVNEFMKEEVLRNLLISEIGEDAVINLMNNEISFSGYKKVTKSFSDVFDTTTNEAFDLIDKYMPHDIEITNNNFNYSLFKMLFDTTFISEDKLEELEFKSHIIKLSYVWKLNEEQMKDVVMSSINKNGEIDNTNISIEAKKQFNRINKNKENRIITIEKDDYLDSIKDDKTLALVNQLESMSPAELLEYKSGIKPSGSEIKLMEDLINNTKFSVGLINFMVLMVLSEKEGKLPGYEYFEKIANTWARAKVKNIPDALKYLEKQNKEADKLNKQINNKKEAKKPDWYGSYAEEMNQKVEENKELSKEDMKEILEEAKDLFGD